MAKLSLECVICGEQFQTYNPNVQCCSRRCSAQKAGNALRKSVVINCAFCGKEITTIPAKMLRKKYCSKECMNEAVSRTAGETKYCSKCGVVKPRADFYQIREHGKNSVSAYCVACHIEVVKRCREKKIAELGYDPKVKRRTEDIKAYLAHITDKARGRAKRNNMECDIDVNYVRELYDAQDGLCALTGVVLTHYGGLGVVPTNVSIDRIDSSTGYLKGNVQLTTTVANKMKQDMTMDYFVRMCESVVKSRWGCAKST